MKKSNLNDFYNSILNIGSTKDYELDILSIVSNEVKELSKHTDSFDGFCKYLSEKISIKLNGLGIRNDIIDLMYISLKQTYKITIQEGQKIYDLKNTDITDISALANCKKLYALRH